MDSNTDSRENIYPCEAASAEQLDKIMQWNFGGINDENIDLQSFLCKRAPEEIHWNNIRHLRIIGQGDSVFLENFSKTDISEGYYINANGQWLLVLLSDEAQINDMLNYCRQNIQSLLIQDIASSAELTSLGTLTSLTKLELLRCYNLTNLPELRNLTRLKVLTISDCNHITALPGLENLTQLTFLVLSGCSLATLPGIECLTHLTTLDFSWCTSLRILPEGIRHCTNLRILDLSGMELLDLPDWLPELAEHFTTSPDFTHGKIKAHICLNETTVEAIPDMSIFDQPYEVVSEFFRVRKSGRIQPLNEIKVVFLGDGESGKSHAIARLMNDGGVPVDYTDQATPGIVIKRKDYAVDGRTFRVNYWDFGGQEIMHSMHRLFLTGRTMYVVLLNARDDTHGDRTKYWLHNIQRFAPDSPVLLVLNKIDQNPNASVDERDLRGQYKNLTSIVRLSAKEFNQREFNMAFTNVLIKDILNTGFLDTEWPTNWTRVKDRLENMEAHYIMGDTYEDICRDCHVDTNQKNLLHWFNDLGISFCYCDEDDYALDDYVILRPDWITNALYILLFNRLEGASNGLIPHDSIYQILRNARSNPDIRCTLPDARYTSSDIHYLLGIMRKFRLSFPYGNSCEFVPMLCDRTPSPKVAEYMYDSQALEFQMEFDYLPDTLLHRLMVDQVNELQIDHVWRTGALFAQSETGLSAMVTIEGNALKIFVKCSDAMHRSNTYLAIIKANIERICSHMGLEIPVGFIVYRHNGLHDTFQYEMLNAMIESGQSAVYSRSFRRMIPITDVVGSQNLQVNSSKDLLVTDIAKACVSIQSNKLYWTATENELNSILRDFLTHQNYYFNDQTHPLDSSSNQILPREIDLIIRNNAQQPFAACELLTIRSKYDLTLWNDHLDMLLAHHDSRELPIHFLISFVRCKQHDYQNLWSVYNSHIREYDSKHGSRMGTYQHIMPLPEFPEYLRVAQCTYDIGGAAVTVYHYFVYLNGQGSLEDSLEDRLTLELEQASTEIAALKEHLLHDLEERKALEVDLITTKQERDAITEHYRAEIESLHSELTQMTEKQFQLKNELWKTHSSLEKSQHSNQILSAERDQIVTVSQKQSEAIHMLQSKIDQLEHSLQTDAQNNQKAAELQILLNRLNQQQQKLIEREKSVKELITNFNKLESLTAEVKQTRHALAIAEEGRQHAVEQQQLLKRMYADSQNTLAQAQQHNAQLSKIVAESSHQVQRLEQALLEAQYHIGIDDLDIVDDNPETAEVIPPAKKEYRVVILGDSEAGKSQILYRLRHPKRNPKSFSGNVTPGIDIASRRFIIPEDEPVKVNFWDFGGQELLHSMHRLFLTKNTMYMIVLNTRNDNQDDQAKFWLHYVEMYAKGAPVILVLNKIDQNPAASLNMPVLKSMFRHTADIIDVLPISASDWSYAKFEDEFVEKLKIHIGKKIDDSNAFTDEELDILAQVREANQEQQILEMSKFRQICQNGKLPPDSDYNKLANRFHKAGMLVYFSTRTNMILSPDWITDIIYKVLERSAAHAINGVIDYEKIEDALYADSNANYTKNQIDFAIKIMRKYGLSFQYQPPVHDMPEQEFIPALCRREQPDAVSNFIANTDIMQMQIFYRYLPSGVLYQLMVDLQSEMVRGNVWLSGAMFTNSDKCTAVVIREKDRMLIFVHGENRVLALQYMETIRERIKGIAMGDMYSTSPLETRLGYYIADRGQVEFFDYDRLSYSKEYQLNYVMSKIKPGALIVSDVLEQRDSTHIQEREELLRLVLKGCRTLQKDQIFWPADENTKNRQLARTLEDGLFRFTAKDQTEGGTSGGGKKPGELDIEISNKFGVPIAILEALKTDSINTADWRQHLNKLVDDYNTSGLRYLILTSYIQCTKDKFINKFNETTAHWRDTTPRGFDNCLESVDTVVLEDCPELIRITRADYIRNNFKVSLYHFLVHIGGEEIPTSTTS